MGCSESSSEYFKPLDLPAPELGGTAGDPEGGAAAGTAAEFAGVVAVPGPSPAVPLSGDAVAAFPELSVAEDALEDDALGDDALAVEFAAALAVPSG